MLDKRNTDSLPLYLLHGWALNAAVFASLTNRISDRLVVAEDLPGHGRRHQVVLSDNIEELVRDTCSNAPERAVWLGWSLGGTVALATASMNPNRCAGLILISATPRFVSAPTWPYGLPAERLDKMARDLAKNPEQTVSDFLALQVIGSQSGRSVLRGMREALAERGIAHPDALTRGLALLRQVDLRRALRDLQLPVLLMGGKLDRLVRPEELRATAEALPNCELHIIQHAAHAPFLSHQDECVSRITRFLEQIDRSE